MWFKSKSWYNWNIVESGVQHHNFLPLKPECQICQHMLVYICKTFPVTLKLLLPNSICSQDIICTTANKCETYASLIHDTCLKTEYYA